MNYYCFCIFKMRNQKSGIQASDIFRTLLFFFFGEFKAKRYIQANMSMTN